MNHSSAYTLKASPLARRLPVFVFSFMFLGGFGLLTSLTGRGTVAIIFAVVWFGLLIFTAWKTLSYPVEISVLGDGRATLRDIFGREREISLHQIESITAKHDHLYIAHRAQTFVAFDRFPNLQRFVQDVRRANPAVKTIGL